MKQTKEKKQNRKRKKMYVRTVEKKKNKKRKTRGRSNKEGNPEAI